MTTTIDYTKEMPVRPIQFDHGQLFNRSRHITRHCPRCFKAIHGSVNKCKCGQVILSK